MRRRFSSHALLAGLPVILCLVFLPAHSSAQQLTREHNILLLNSYHKEFEWTDRIVEGVKAALAQEDLDIELFVEYMDTRRNRDPKYLELLHQLYFRKYRQTRIDLVLTSDDEAFEFMKRHHRELFPDTPVVFCGVDSIPAERFSALQNFTGILEVVDFRSTLELALGLHPETRRIAVLLDDQAKGMRKVLDKLAPEYPHLEFLYLDGSEMLLSEVLDGLSRIPHDTVVLATAFLNDYSGEFFPLEESARRIYENTSVPMYGINRNLLELGIVGGHLADGYFHGFEAGIRAAQVLRGVSPEQLPPVSRGGDRYFFDFRELNRWGISATSLPKGSIVVNRPTTLYSEFRGWIWAVFSFLILQTVIISFLLMNISKRKKAEELLRRSERSLARAQSVARLGSWEQDLVSGELTWSTETYRIFGCNPEETEITNQAFFELVHPDDRELVAETARKARESDAPYRIEHRVVRPDGSERLVREQAEIVRDEKGRALRMLCTVQDITDHRQLEEQLRQSQKMEAVGQLAGGIAHDFNNLMMAITGYSELILQKLAPNDPVRADLEEIRRSGDRAARLTRQLLAFSRRQVLRTRLLNLNHIVAEMRSLLKRVIPSHIELVTRSGRNLGLVRADPSQVEQVVLNLVINARDAMPDGGTIVIETSDVSAKDQNGNPEEPLPWGEYVRLTVSDTGTGMTPETKARIFEPFFSTKEQGKGTGLGLSTVYGIVHQSDGRIFVHSEENQGTTFRIYFPRVKQAGDSPRKDESSRTDPERAATVLLVEDEDSVRKLVAEVLRRDGLNVVETADAQGALNFVLKDDCIPDLLVTDAVMPGLNGSELAKKIIELVPGIRVLIISGYTQDSVVSQGILESGVDFLQKPFPPTKLVARIREMLSGHASSQPMGTYDSGT